ncbi:hypothetical protein AB833_09965 [Chromatiales bacterium (ex Bugula neritina AB1)]|nr:hypothetical protein AB833_09965 [Chromatiales bacterium (ex Bugula neritina AB1)]
MNRLLIAAASVVCLLAVAVGAFGVHMLQGVLQGKALGWYQTAVQYQYYHGLGMFVSAVLSMQLGRSASRAGWLMLAGIIIFCGSLYAMALGAPRWLGAVTPIGGLCFLAAWALLAIVAIRQE